MAPSVGEDLTPKQAVTNYNNFYEFTTSKEGVAKVAADFKTDGWTPTEVEEQVLTPLSKKSIMGTNESDPLSIMFTAPFDDMCFARDLMCNSRHGL